MKVNRGGHTLKTGKIGRVNCIRQQIMMPGERMDISMKGTIRLESLRERDTLRINAHLATFMTPLRWLWEPWPQYVTDGPEGPLVPPKTGTANLAVLGIGAFGAPGASLTYNWWEDAYLKVVNEWYKWPESIDYVGADIGDTGVKGVPLSKTWSRCRFDATPIDTENYMLPAATEFDVRDLAEKQAKFRSAMKRDVFSYGRWMELVKETWKGDGSREVDQVPIMLDSTSVGVNPREMAATDGASLGQWQALFDFNVDHQIKSVVAPEHCIITHMLIIRFSATMESVHPLARAPVTANYEVLVGDPEFLASAKPVEVERRELMQSGLDTSFGFLPAGWQWRADSDVIGKAIDIRDSFPYMLEPTTQAECKDATRVKSAFRSQALDDYMVDVFFRESSHQPIGDSMDSYMSGMVDDAQVKPGGKGQEFPKGGKML